ncbi:CBL-interacting serine/threonine-protein kinase 3 [Glycine soja]
MANKMEEGQSVMFENHVYEVMHSGKKLFIVLEHVTGGKLFDKILEKQQVTDKTGSTKYFQRLICKVAFCQSRGVSHGNLKPQNLLLDAKGVLKLSDFGMRPLSEQVPLHTPCSTPHYMASKVASITGYEGAHADILSCGVILFVLLASYLPFNDKDIKTLYVKVTIPKCF